MQSEQSQGSSSETGKLAVATAGESATPIKDGAGVEAEAEDEAEAMAKVETSKEEDEDEEDKKEDEEGEEEGAMPADRTSWSAVECADAKRGVGW